jgi:LPXTG-motif cell wall-anchored protein
MVSLLLTLTASAALAAVPSTADYRNATTPMITGRVLMVSEHDMVVSTEQGNEVPLTLDTRTMLPADLAQDMMVRVEFHYLDDGTRYAKRVIPIRHGDRLTRELAYSQERDDDEAVARYAAAYAEPEHMAQASRVASVTNQPLGTALRPIPSTDDYQVATRAMVVGRVIAVTDHRIVVDTDQRQRVAVEMDSRTLVPTDLQSGIGVRIEYRAMDNGDRLATRIVPIRFERIEGGRLQQDLAYPSDQDYEEMPNIDAQTAEYQGHGEVVADNQHHEEVENEAAGHEENLPRTSSSEPLLVLVGLLALGAGAAVMLRRTSQVG